MEEFDYLDGPHMHEDIFFIVAEEGTYELACEG